MTEINNHEGWNQVKRHLKNVEQRFRARAVTRSTADLKLAVIKTHAVLAVAMTIKSSQ